MDYGIADILKLLGSLVFFLFGMKLMSESLQKVAGDRMRSILAAMTSNRFKGILTGFLITAIIQSSSATTVMLVSFVNAGLLSLIQSIGVIMGANIGTTVTAWLISILGFKVNMSHLVLPLMGLALPLIFSKNRKRSNWGGVIIGFAIIFIGLDFLKNSTPDINNNPELLQYLAQFNNLGFGSILIYLGIGTILTLVIQSSSAVMALTLVMCYNGWLSFEMAAAMVLGQNIGTTITANLASLIANVSAKRAARAHLLFNVLGVVLALLIFIPFLNLVNWITIKTGSFSPYEIESQTFRQTSAAIPVALSIFHSVFNVLNTFILIWFVPLLMKIVIYMVPQKEEDEEFRLQFISTGLLSTGELSILQAKKETILYAKRMEKMFQQTHNLLFDAGPKKAGKLLDKLRKSEDISDEFEVEITTYLTRISEESLSSKGSENINSLLFVISHLEEIGDACFAMANIIDRKNDNRIKFNKDMRNNLARLFDLCGLQLREVRKNLESDGMSDRLNKAVKINTKLKNRLKTLRNEHYKSLKKKQYKCKDGIIYSDLYGQLGRIENYAYEINKVLYEVPELVETI